MADNAQTPHVHWVCPEMRGQLSITDIHLPRRLIKTLRGYPYEIRINTAFVDTIKLCAQAADNRPETWINDNIMQAFILLHQQGHAHSVECWRGNTLVGGLYGIAMGGAFFGESMFSRARDASKIALAHLAARLWKGGFSILDTQFTNDHLMQFGVYEMPFDEYKAQLDTALQNDADFLLRDNALSEQNLLLEYLKMRKDNGS